MTSPGRTIAVRLEGGLGDHLLGMRLLRFIRLRYPDHNIVAYSDAEGSKAQLEVARMSPHVSDVKVLKQDPLRVTEENIGSLTNLTSESLATLRDADDFFDGHTAGLFLNECYRLGASHFEVLSSLPDLVIPSLATAHSRSILNPLPCRKYIGLNLTKYGPSVVRANLDLIRAFLSDVLADGDVGVLNFYTRGYEFPHAPEPSRTRRRRTCEAEAAEMEGLSALYPGRVFSIIDQPIGVVSALLKKCFYFVGVDNGIKHLAWALDIPRTWLSPGGLGREFILRWAPDYSSMIEVRQWDALDEIGKRIASRASAAKNQAGRDPHGKTKSVATAGAPVGIV